MSHALELGGAERSLIGLLDAIDTQKYEVDLFLMRHEGELLGAIPNKINLLPQIPAYTVLARPMKDVLAEGHLFLTFARVIGKIVAKRFVKKYQYTESGVALEYSHKYTCRLMPKINPDIEYDVAISFLTPHYFVAEKVRAKKKIAWIHTDYGKIQIDKNSELKMWDRYDHIISISENVSVEFLSIFSELKEKIVLIENILPKKLIEIQKDEFSAEKEMSAKGIKLLSIGRYCAQKNFDNVPEICSKILQQGLDVYWYIIGFGPDEQLIKEKIQQFKMEDRVILLGKKENPYPYIKLCDIYVQPSRYEGKSVTVREAQMLHKPVIISNYSTAKTQLEDGFDGIIVPQENKKCANRISEILRNEVLRQKLIENTYNVDYSNKEEIEKLYTLFK